MYNRKLCCKVPVVGPAGPQGATGPQGPAGEDAATDNALLYFQDFGIPSSGVISAARLDFDNTKTTQYGFGASKYLTHPSDPSSNITFSSVPADHYIEIYAFCSVVYDDTSVTTNGFLRLELEALGTSPTVLSIIDGRTVRGQEGTTFEDRNYLAFGPAAFNLTASGPLLHVLDRTTEYRLQATAGPPGVEAQDVRVMIKARRTA